MATLTPHASSEEISPDAIPARGPDVKISSFSVTRPRFVHPRNITSAEQIFIELRQKRDGFAARSPDSDTNTYNVVDCSTVLRIYDEAIAIFCDAPDKHQQIASECNLKVQIILALLKADPDHPAFLSAGQLLSPLEPQYANPRIDSEDDDYGYRAEWRLSRWRKEDWPKMYPAKAIKKELEKERLVGRNRMTDDELRMKFYEEEGILEEENFKRRTLEAQNGRRRNKGAKKTRNTQESRDEEPRESLGNDEMDVDEEIDIDEEIASWGDSDDDPVYGNSST
jgi:hypothetical protein